MTGTSTLELNWHGPHRLPESLFRPESGIPEATGVYIWALPSGGEHLISYIGYAANLRERQYNHVVLTLGGGYWIPTRNPEGEGYAREGAQTVRGASWETAFSRLELFVKDDGARRRPWDYLSHEVEVFYAAAANGPLDAEQARDAEYIMQAALRSLEPSDPMRAAYPWVTLQGSRYHGRVIEIAHRVPDGVRIRGLKTLTRLPSGLGG